MDTSFGASKNSRSVTNQSNPIRILIVDDHPVVCSGLSNMLSAEEEFDVVGTAASGEEALAMVRESEVQLMLLDLRMPGMDGVATIEALNRLKAKPYVLVLTSSDKDENIYRSIRAGARGYLLKDTTEEEMFDAIRAVAAGKRYIPRQIAAILADRMLREDLTARELQVLEHMAHGSTNKQIASTLHISENTVRHHVISIMGKLHASDRTEAVALALRRGVLAEKAQLEP